MNRAIDLLYLAKQSQVEILLNGEQLQVKLPRNGRIPENLLKEIRDNKKLIIDFLRSHERIEKKQNKINSIDKTLFKHIPLSFSQGRLFFIDSLGGTVPYHIPLILRLKGNLNRKALEYALQNIVLRHEVLRTVIREEDDEAYQYVREAHEWEFPVCDGSQYKDNDTWLQQFIEQLIKEPFDLSNDYMLRATLIALDPTDHVLVITIHHIASDGWSTSILIKEVTELYNALNQQRPHMLEPLQIQYADYAIWQRQYLTGELLENKLGYWRNKLRELVPLQLSTDFMRPAMQSSKGNIVGFSIDKQLSTALQELSQQQGTTIFMTLLAAFNVLLFRYSGQKDICIGSPFSNRTHEELELLIGFFVNTLALRNEVDSDKSFVDLLQQVKATTLEGYTNQDVPFEKVVEAIVKERDMSRSPLFQVMFVLQNAQDSSGIHLDDLNVVEENFALATSKFDLSLHITHSVDGSQGGIEYCTDLFREETIVQMITHFKALLFSIINNPQQAIGSLPMLNQDETNQLLVDFNDTGSPYPADKTIIDLFEEQVKKTPDSIALIFETGALSYHQLNERSNQLAHYLQRHGVKQEDLVPICIDRSLEMIIGILGILKAGAASVPIDPAYPQERISFMLEDTGAKTMVTSHNTRPGLQVSEDIDMIELDNDWPVISKELPTSPPAKSDPHQLAYVIYTSGSTGRPKGVLIEHIGVVSLVKGIDYVSLGEDNILLSTGSSSFDATTFEYWGMLLNGGQLIVCPEEKLLETGLLKTVIKARQVNIMWFTSSWFNQLVESDISVFEGLKTILVGGEKLSAHHIQKTLQTYPLIEIINGYGPTENTTFSLTYSIKEIPQNGSIPIGRPLSNRTAYILSGAQQLAPVGVPGEICIGGAGLARGYLNRPELSQEKFIADPFSNEAGKRIYKTGDLGRWLPGGNIEYLGRMDNQVKVRGYRIELGEIETVLMQSGLVSQAVVLAISDTMGAKKLVGYIVPKNSFDKQAVNNYLSAKLPQYMVPVLWVELDRLPITPNGKIDMRALPDPDAGDLSTNKYVAPRNELETDLAGIWEKLLAAKKLGIHDNFFELGGNSLLAMRVIAAIRRKLGMEVAIKDLFVHPTISELSLYLEEHGRQSLLPSVEWSTKRPEHIPLSFSQERLWFIDRLEGSEQYHIPTVLRSKGRLNKASLEYALKAIIKRHEVLRSVIHDKEGNAWQSVKEPDDWSVLKVDGAKYKNDAKGLQLFIADLIKQPFDLSQDYMLRATLVSLDEADHVLVIVIHHIAFDGWSMSIIVKEIMELYNSHLEDRPAKLPVLSLQYADYAIWQRSYLQGNVLNNKISYWKEKLKDIAPLELQTDRQRTAFQTTNGAITTFRIDKDLSEQLLLLSQQQGTTIFMTLLAAFNVLLFRYSGQKDICVGSPFSNRTHEELELLIGFFVNTLALRNEVDSDKSFVDLLQQVKATTLEGYTNQDVPFEKVVEAIVKERDMSRSPLFQVMFVLQNAQEYSGIHLDDLNLVQERFAHATSKFDLSLHITHSVDGSQGGIEYCTDLFREETIVQMITHFKALLFSIINNPQQAIGSLPMLNQNETNQLLVDFNDTGSPYPADKTIIDLFEEQVKKTPDSIALIFETGALSYHQLNERSNQLAHYLQRHGVKQEDLVPICIERSLEMIIGILGILKAGAAYVPIDPAYPQERISFMLEDTGAKTMVTSHNTRPGLQVSEDIDMIELDNDWPVISKELPTSPPAKSDPHQLAYVIYTSGSTGRPKGVLIEHIGVVSLVKGIDYVLLGEDNILLSTGSSSFDATTFEYWGMLLNGGQLIVCPEEKLLETGLLKTVIKARQVNIMWFTSSWFNQLVESDISVFEGLKTILVGGEKLSAHHIQKTLQTYPLIEIINGYGPTENTTFSLTYSIKEIPQNGSIPIGRPLSNRTAYILSDAQQLAPVGVPGEICIGGAGLARGYLNRPELSQEKFIADPFSNEAGKRIYKTGDLGRWLPGGNIEYLGRMDNQVKVRGYRIELGEIETVLMQSGLVSQAVVLAKEDSTGAKLLVGYVVPGSLFDKQAIISFLSARLPDYMVPVLWVELERLPITANGKINTRALPAPEKIHLSTNEFIAPRNKVEEKLTIIWQKILKVDSIGMNDNFFSMGGHSLTALRIVSAMKKEMGVELMIKQLFLNPTLGKLAAYIQGKANEYSLNASHFKSLIQIKKGTDKLPLYIVCGGGGTVFKFREFADMLNENQSVYGLEQPSEINGMKEFPKTVEGIAATYINEIIIQNPEGPYALSGHCLGGIIAFEMAKQLEASGREVKVLALFDTMIYEKAIVVEKTFKNFYQVPHILRRFVSWLWLKLDFEIHLFRKYPKHAIGYKIDKLRSLTNKFNPKKPKDEAFEVFKELEQNFIKAAKKYLITPYDKEVIVFYAKDHYYFLDQARNVLFKKSTLNDQTKNSWNQYVKSVSIYEVEGEHSTIFKGDNSREFAKILQRHLDKSIGGEN